MNSISMFLYFADVFDNLRTSVIILLIIGYIAAAVFTVCGIFLRSDRGMYHGETGATPKDWWEARRVQCRSYSRIAWATSIICNLAVVFVPSKTTMYAIAASQIGEQVIKSEIGNDASKAVHQWIKRQLEPEPKKDK